LSKSFPPFRRNVPQNSSTADEPLKNTPKIQRVQVASPSEVPDDQDDVEPPSTYPQSTHANDAKKSKKEYKILIEKAQAIRKQEATDFDKTKATEFLTSEGCDIDTFNDNDIFNFTKNVNKKSKEERRQNPKYLEFEKRYEILVKEARDTHNLEKQEDDSYKGDFTVDKARKFLESKGYYRDMLDDEDDIHGFFRHVTGKSPAEKMENLEYRKIYDDREQIIEKGRILKRQKAEENKKPYRKITRKDVKEVLGNNGYNPTILSNKELDELAEKINRES